VVN
jgi:hypothetical protein